ncbi:unnamed protein product [Rotaria sp. Silwood1]|nr:unnamed protein product [Rotaria sp. Silwood1]CAF3405867.1 unnamed protein product [Rotaria sp. Silwood1]CAF3423573.1 unnamed protein product [Rotaria sp. Silwood1]CAF4556574.1 unnamed protein product [Rotaria sp. Silwood1]
MSQLVSIPSNNTSKLSNTLLKKDWNEYQHLSTQGRYIEPKIFSGFQNHRIKLTSVKKQLYNPKVPSIRRIEHDEILCRLPDEHSRHTTSFSEAQFQNFDPKRDESFLEFTGLNWHNTGKSLLGITDSPLLQNDFSVEFGARLRADKSQKNLRPSQTKIYRSPSLFSTSPSTALTKMSRYNDQNCHRNNSFSQSARTRHYLNKNNSNRPMQSTFRSSNMYADQSVVPWYPISNSDGSKSTRF